MSYIKVKIFFYLFIFSFLFIINSNYVKAGVTMDITGSNTYNGEITVSIKSAKDRVLIYDTSSVSCSNSVCTDASFYGNSGRIISSGDAVFKFKIKTKEAKQIDFSIEPQSKDGSGIILKKPYLLNGYTTTTQPSATSSQTTAVTKSLNANLKSFTVKTNDNKELKYSPEFNSSVYSYSLTIDGSISNINIEYVKEDEKSTVIISDNVKEELKEGQTTKIDITVTSESGNIKIYSLNVKREVMQSDALLKELTIKELPTFKLVEGKYSYTINVSNNIDKLNIDAVKSNDKSVVTITGNENLKNGSKIKVLVQAEDGTKKEYELIISKKVTTTAKVEVDTYDKDPLIIIILSTIALILSGTIVYVIKK